MVVAVVAFIVRVPVLSLLMTVTPPRFSTWFGGLTLALCWAAARAEDGIAFTNIGRPVGIAAITVEMHNSAQGRSPGHADPEDGDDRHGRKTDHADLVMPSSSAATGTGFRLGGGDRAAILPISVPLQIAVTTIVADPPGDLGIWNPRLVPVAEGHLSLGQRTGVPGVLEHALPPVGAASCSSSVAED